MKANAILYKFISIFIICLTGCITIPEKIKDEYLAEKTPEQTEALEKIEQSIITKKNEKDEQEKSVLMAEQKIIVSEKKLAVLEKEESLLKEEENLAKINKNDEEQKIKKVEIKDKQKGVLIQGLKLAWIKDFRNNEKAILEVRQAELAALIAEMNYKKAVIADKYLNKKHESAGENQKDKKNDKSFIEKLFGGSDDKIIDVKKYEEYLKKCGQELDKKKNEQKDADRKLQKALNDLRNAGYKGEL